MHHSHLFVVCASVGTFIIHNLHAVGAALRFIWAGVESVAIVTLQAGADLIVCVRIWTSARLSAYDQPRGYPLQAELRHGYLLLTERCRVRSLGPNARTNRSASGFVQTRSGRPSRGESHTCHGECTTTSEETIKKNFKRGCWLSLTTLHTHIDSALWICPKKTIIRIKVTKRGRLSWYSKIKH